jgi:hypothetical protein
MPFIRNGEVMIVPDDDSLERLNLLHGKKLGGFFQVAVSNGAFHEIAWR